MTGTVRPASVRGELVTFDSPSGARLHGIVYEATDAGATVVHVHGSFGNFYANQFVRVMAEVYVAAGLNFLSFNTTGHDGIAEGERRGEFEYVGGAMVPFEDTVLDVAGAVQFAKGLSSRIALQGHSLGCDRVLSLVLREQLSNDVILLAPCDSRELQQRWRAPETVAEQIARLRSTPADDRPLLPWSEYGIGQGDGWDYPIPVSRKALLGVMEGTPFRLIRFSAPAAFEIRGRCLVYVGGQDRLQTCPAAEVFAYFRDRSRSCEAVFVGEGDHMLKGCERRVAAAAATWIKQGG